MVMATLKEADIIHFAKQKIVRLAVRNAWKRVKPLIDKKEKDGMGVGWRRTTTPYVRGALISAVNQVMDYPRVHEDGDPKTVYLAIDVFSLIYDTDNNYANMFHYFLKLARTDENLKNIKFGKYYQSRGTSLPEQREYAKSLGLEPDCFL